MENQLPPSRRNFLQGGAAAAATLTIVSPRTAFTYDANSRVTVGLIGTGGRGSYDATITNADPRARVTAMCDLFDDRIETNAPRIKVTKPAVYRDFEKLLASPDIDAVIIGTPPFEHPRMLEAAVQAKKHIYCEKPAGVDLEGVRRVIAAGHKCDPKKNLSFGFQQRYGPVYLEAYKRVKEGGIGEMANARGFWIDRDPFQRKPYADPKVEKLRNWFCYREYSGDIIVEQDCHNLDVLHWFLGTHPVRAVGMGGRKIRTTMEILDHLTVVYEFPGNLHVNFEANQISPAGFHRVGEEFTGTTAVIETSRQRMV
ncbi:MAG: Gfo/Idh/MocA family protein, partial [Terriglobales bacterium]